MLTTDGLINYDEYGFKSSPESSSDSFMTGILRLQIDRYVNIARASLL